MIKFWLFIFARRTPRIAGMDAKANTYFRVHRECSARSCKLEGIPRAFSPRKFIIITLICAFFIPFKVLADTNFWEITQRLDPCTPPWRGWLYYQKDLTVNFSGGKIIFSSNSDGPGDTYVYDRIDIIVTRPDGSVAPFTKFYLPNDTCSGSG